MRLLPLPGTFLLAALVAWLGWQVTESRPVGADLPAEMEPPPGLSEVETPTRDQTRVLQSEAYYSAISERPLFEPSRRPLVEPEPEPEVVEETPEPEPAPPPVRPPEPEPMPEFGLHGVMLQDGRDAALISVDGGPPVWVERNQLINDWILGEITTDSVELHKGPQRLGVQLHEGE